MAHEHTFEFEEANREQQNGLQPNKCLTCVKTNVITLATVAGVVLGAILGIILRQVKDDWTDREIMYVGYIGDVFLQMLKSLIIPLIVSSLVSAIAGLDISLSGKIAARAVAFYLTTTFAAVLLGMILVSTIRPGVGSTVNETTTNTVTERNTTTADTLLDLIKNMFPPNIPEALIFQYRTKLTPRNDFDTDKFNFKISTEIVQTTNILGLIIVSFVTGVALAQLGKETQVIADFFHQIMTLTMKITMWVIKLSPVGVMFLVTCKILEMEDFGQVMSSLGMYFLTVCLGLFIQGFIVIPCLYMALTRKNPIHFINAMGQALATAFGTGSSSATLPITIRCLEENLGVDPRVARFTLPIGAAINMDGTALYEAVAAIFIAQVRGVHMDIGTLVAISITATAASIGAAGIPQAGLVTMVMVLDTVGLPAEDVTLILAVDWFLDRLRTAINVLGDAVGSAIVNHRSQKELNEASKEIPPIPTHGPAIMDGDHVKDSATLDIDHEKN